MTTRKATRKPPTTATHEQCRDHIAHTYPTNGWLCVRTDEPTRGADMVAFADHLATVAAAHRAAELERPRPNAAADPMYTGEPVGTDPNGRPILANVCRGAADKGDRACSNYSASIHLHNMAGAVHLGARPAPAPGDDILASTIAAAAVAEAIGPATDTYPVPTVDQAPAAPAEAPAEAPDVLAGVTVITADGTYTGAMRADDSIRIDAPADPPAEPCDHRTRYVDGGACASCGASRAAQLTPGWPLLADGTLAPAQYRLRAFASWSDHSAGLVAVDTVYADRAAAMAARNALPYPVVDVVAEPVAAEPDHSAGHIGYSWTIESGIVEVFAIGASIARAPLSAPLGDNAARFGREWWPIGERFVSQWRPLVWPTVDQARADMAARSTVDQAPAELEPAPTVDQAPAAPRKPATRRKPRTAAARARAGRPSRTTAPAAPAEAPTAPPVLSIVRRAPDGRPRCARCGQTFRRTGRGYAWHRDNRPECAAELERSAIA